MKKEQFNTEQKQLIVQEILTEGLLAVSERYEIPLDILKVWQRDYEVLPKTNVTERSPSFQSIKIMKLETENSVLRERLIEECQNALYNTMQLLNDRKITPTLR